MSFSRRFVLLFLFIILINLDTRRRSNYLKFFRSAGFQIFNNK